MKCIAIALLLVSAWTMGGEQGRQAISLQSMKVKESGRSADFGSTWRAYGQMAQIFYVQGFVEGELNGGSDAATSLEPRCSTAVAAWRNTTVESAGVIVGTVVKVMSELYQDSANSYIPFAQMFYIARAKLKGENVEDSLSAARARALTPSHQSPK